MSKQREVLPKALDIIFPFAPSAAVFLSGSVYSGNERLDSDIDLIVVVPDVTQASYPEGIIRDESRGFKFVDATFDGVPLEIIFLTPSYFEEMVCQQALARVQVSAN